MDLVCYDGVVAIVEDVEEFAVSCECHIEISTANGRRVTVEQRDLSIASNSIGGDCSAVGVVSVGKLTVLGYY